VKKPDRCSGGTNAESVDDAPLDEHPRADRRTAAVYAISSFSFSALSTRPCSLTCPSTTSAGVDITP